MTTRDYRIFVGAFPTGQLTSDLQAVREQYDAATARITPPHVTLAGTYWRSGLAMYSQGVFLFIIILGLVFLVGFLPRKGLGEIPGQTQSALDIR